MDDIVRATVSNGRMWEKARPNQTALSDISSAIILANSLVISELDYCNSLLNGLPKSSINHLQVVQNFLAPSAKQSDHVSPLLHKLHWLPVSSRMEF